MKIRKAVGLVFTSMPYNPGVGYPIGKNGSIPWYISQERIQFSKLVSPYSVVGGRVAWGLFSQLSPAQRIILTHQKVTPDQYTKASSVSSALIAAKHNVVMVVGGRRTLESFWNLADFIIIHEVDMPYFCNDFLQVNPASEEFEKVFEHNFRDLFTDKRFLRKSSATTVISTNSAPLSEALPRLGYDPSPFGLGK